MHSTQSLWAASTGISFFIEDKTGRTDKSQCFYTLTEMVFEVLVAVFQITFLLWFKVLLFALFYANRAVFVSVGCFLVAAFGFVSTLLRKWKKKPSVRWALDGV